MLAILALGAAVPLALKILPSVGLLVGAIALVVFGMELGGDFSNEDTEQKAVYALLTALLSITLALGGFAARQFLKYKSRRLEFPKKSCRRIVLQDAGRRQRRFKCARRFRRRGRM